MNSEYLDFALQTVREMTRPRELYYLHFVDGGDGVGEPKPVGACFVQAHGWVTAMRAALDLQIRPMAERLAFYHMPVPENVEIPERYQNRLLSLHEEEFVKTQCFPVQKR